MIRKETYRNCFLNFNVWSTIIHYVCWGIYKQTAGGFLWLCSRLSTRYV